MMDQLRMESYGFCCKMRVTAAVSLVGWSGIIISVLSIIAGILLAALTPYSGRNVSITSGVITIIVFLILFIMNICLIKRNMAGSFSGVKRILRIICNFLLSIQMIGSLLLLGTSLYFIIRLGSLLTTPYYLIPVLSILLFILVLVWTGFLSIGIHGIRKNRKSLINAYIIFNMVLVVVQIVLQILNHNLINAHSTLVGLIIPVVMSIVYFFYLNGYFMILYNIMDISLDKGQEMNPV